MTPDAAATTSTPAPQALAPQVAAPVTQPAPAPQAAPAAPATSPTPVQLFWDVAQLAFELLTRLIQVLKPVQSSYLKQSWQVVHLCTDLPRIMLTIRFAPERITTAQFRHLSRARQVLQALFGYTLPGAQTPSSANATSSQSPSASTENLTPTEARNPSSATPGIRQVPEIPLVAGVRHVPASPASPQVPGSSSLNPASPTLNIEHLTDNNSHSSPDSQIPHTKIPHSSFAPYIPDSLTLTRALKADSLPPNCAGALLDDPGEALVKALHQLHAIYFSLYPNQPTPPIPYQSPSPAQSSANPQSGNPQSDAPSVHSVHPVHPVHPVHNDHPVHSVHSVHSPSSVQSEISNLKSEIPHSSAPP